MTWRLYRPEVVAKQIKALPERYRPAVVDVLERVLANPHAPAGCTLDRVRGRSKLERDRLVVEAGIGVFVTYELLEGVPPVMNVPFVRVVAVTPLGEYQRPF